MMITFDLQQLRRCGREGQNRNISRAFDRCRYRPLMFGAVAGNPAGNDLAPFGNKVSQDTRVLIIDIDFFVGAKSTNLAS